MESGETEAVAAVREIKEETNLDIVLGEKIGTLDIGDSLWHFYVAKQFYGELKLGSPEFERQSPDNIYQLEWIPLEKLNNINLLPEIRNLLLKHLSPLSGFLGKVVAITVDRPIGGKHPGWGFTYEVNYGYVPDTKGADGEEIDAYILGVRKPVKEFSGECIAIIHRLNDDDDKLVIAPVGTSLSDEEIRSQTYFQERFFKSIIIRDK